MHKRLTALLVIVMLAMGVASGNASAKAPRLWQVQLQVLRQRILVLARGSGAINPAISSASRVTSCLPGPCTSVQEDFLLGVARFDTTVNAQQALQPLLKSWLSNSSIDSSQLRMASVRSIGDKSAAIAGQITGTNNDGSTWKGDFTAIVVAKGTLVWYGYADATEDTDALFSFAPIVEKLVEKATTPPPSDLLTIAPGVDDVPEGWLLEFTNVFGR